ncbi:MAG: cytochrome c-type biogenesis protein [Pseudomonadales bacterium]
MMQFARWGFLIYLLLGTQAHSVIESYPFSDDSLRQRYSELTEIYRCPKCQNQNLAGSDAPIAQDLRREIYRMLNEGQSDAEIGEFLVSRYGEFVLYKPPVNWHTIILWALPAFALFMSVLIVVLFVRKRSVTAPLSEAENQRLQRILDGDKPQ